MSGLGNEISCLKILPTKNQNKRIVQYQKPQKSILESVLFFYTFQKLLISLKKILLSK